MAVPLPPPPYPVKVFSPLMMGGNFLLFSGVIGVGLFTAP